LAEQGNRIVWKPNLPVLAKSIHQIGSFPSDLLSRKFTAPTLFIRGENSPFIPVEEFPKLQEIFTQAKLHTVPNAGHWPHADNTKDFLAALTAFLNN